MVRGHRLFGELPVGFVGEGVKRVLIVYAALSLSHLRCQLSPGESLGLSVLFVRCVTSLFAGIVHCTREGRPLPYGRSAHSVSNRGVSGYRMLFTGGKTDYTEQTDNCR